MACRTLGFAAGFIAQQADRALFMAMTRLIATPLAVLQLPGGMGQATDYRYDIGRYGEHVDAVDRARGQAQVAAGALGCDHGVHQLARPDYGIDWTGLDALGAADALRFAYERHLRWCAATLWVRRDHREVQQGGQGLDGFAAAWRTFIDRFARGKTFGIGPTAWVAAFTALGLR